MRVRTLFFIFALFILNVLGAMTPLPKPTVEPPAVHVKKECVRSSTICRQGAFGNATIGDTALCPLCVVSCKRCEDYIKSRWWCRWFGSECEAAKEYVTHRRHGVS